MIKSVDDTRINAEFHQFGRIDLGGEQKSVRCNPSSDHEFCFMIAWKVDLAETANAKQVAWGVKCPYLLCSTTAPHHRSSVAKN